jgi:hypothetical protein
MGWGGELVTAQFLATDLLDASTLRRSANTNSTQRVGLFIDARCIQGARLMKRIMESEEITKLIWGADGDLVSLRHQWCLEMAAAPYEAIRPENVVDIQLGFSSENKRMGMASMMKEISYGHPNHTLLLQLPSKELPGDFYAPFGRNKRCFPLPLTEELAKYSVDDLHRIETILETRNPEYRDFAAAKRATERLITSLESPDHGVEWTDRERGYYRRKYGSKKQEKAVQIYRAARHLELAFGTLLSSRHTSKLQTARDLVQPELRNKGVTVPDDLSFHG